MIENGALEINGENQLNLTVQAAEGSSFETNLKHLEGMNQRQATRLLVNRWLDAAPTVVFLLIPAFTLVLEGLTPKFLVIEHLVLSTLLHAQALILMGFAAVIGSPHRIRRRCALDLRTALVHAVAGVSSSPRAPRSPNGSARAWVTSCCCWAVFWPRHS